MTCVTWTSALEHLCLLELRVQLVGEGALPRGEEGLLQLVAPVWLYLSEFLLGFCDWGKEKVCRQENLFSFVRPGRVWLI